ncbi:MAG: hypothetical protein LAQ30_12710, partial [Acidobacteriia bacterium]|nr:hypothetical protein [Terriglobia bacterium]
AVNHVVNNGTVLVRDAGTSLSLSSSNSQNDSGTFDANQVISNYRLIGRSVWNTRWLLIIPAGELLSDRNEAIQRFINGALLPGGTRDGNSLVISGGGKRRPAESLPAGQYDLRFLVSETPIRNATARMEIPKNGEAAVQLNIASPGFQFALADPAEWDPETRAVCERQGSQIDAMDPLTWLSQPLPRLARKACLLNLLAKARSLPSARPGESLCPLIESIHWADVDRIDVKGAGLLPKLRSMTDWKDPAPVHPAHAQTLSSIFGGSPGDYSVESFREPVSERSMQVVVGTHRSSGLEYAEFDIDLGNPGVDLAGLCIHIGELIDPGRTNHLDLYPHLRAGAASDFMYYKLEMASGQVAAHGKS